MLDAYGGPGAGTLNIQDLGKSPPSLNAAIVLRCSRGAAIARCKGPERRFSHCLKAFRRTEGDCEVLRSSTAV